MKKVLFLGGSTQQLPAIHYAKKNGYSTILCDYLKDNPGQYYTDKFYCESTTDKETICKIAMQEKVDGIVAYASDPASATAAYVSDKLNLPSNLYESVLVLSNKELFREFLFNNNLNCPKAKSFKSVEEAIVSLSEFQFPLIVKPTDSSGSKGVSKIEKQEELYEAFNMAISYSKNKKVIVEEFIEMSHEYMVGGDIFVINGKIEFWGLLNCHRSIEISSLLPIGKSYPLLIEEERVHLIHDELQKVIRLLGITMGAFNIEVMFSKDGDPYIIEMGPRNGGNMIPQLLEIITGVDLVEATVEAALGKVDELKVRCSIPLDSFFSTYIIHSSKAGALKNIFFSEDIQGNIIDKILFIEANEKVEIFDNSNKAIGIIFLKYKSLEELIYKMTNMNKFVEIQLDHIE